MNLMRPSSLPSGWGLSLSELARQPAPKSEFVKKGQWVALVVVLIALGLGLYLAYRSLNG